jgi:hypothetical protein
MSAQKYDIDLHEFHVVARKHTHGMVSFEPAKPPLTVACIQTIDEVSLYETQVSL